MTRAQFYVEKLGMQAAFPWACENFANYLKEDSFWLKHKLAAELLYAKKLGEKLSSGAISKASRHFESTYERSNNLAAFDWSEMVFEDKEHGVLYVTGAVDLTEDSMVELITKYELSIVHEPFNCKYRANFLLIGEDYSGVAPKNALFEQQKAYVNTIAGKRTPVGIHIRRGDYIKWQSGAYFYDDAYWCRNVIRLINDGKSVWVFSNDLSEKLSQELTDAGAHVSNESFEIDFVRLMQMHTVYGPPSTFSAKALAVCQHVYGQKKNLIYLPKIL